MHLENKVLFPRALEAQRGHRVALRQAPMRRALIHSLTKAGDSRAATYPLLGLLRALRPWLIP